jgi:hypothetical protein
VIGVNALLFVAGADDEAGVAILAEQKNIGLNHIIGPVYRAIHQLSATFVGVIAHRSVGKLPGAAKSLPILSTFIRLKHRSGQQP